MKDLVSYWKLDDDYMVYEDNDFKVIKGFYNHKHQSNNEKVLGICWGDYPKSRGKLSPVVITKEARDAFLNGLLSKLSDNKNKREKILNAIDFFNN